MIVLKRLLLLTLILGFIITAGFTVKAHWSVNTNLAHLYFESDPKVTCDIDGKRFTHTRITKDGKLLVDFWHEQPRNPKFTVTAKAHGRGWAYYKLSGEIDGKPFGDAKNWTESEKLGRWSQFLPFARDGDHDLEYSVYGEFYYPPPKVYEWKAKGVIKLVPWRWEYYGFLSNKGGGIGGKWVAAEKEDHTKKFNEPTGSWVVDRNWKNDESGSKKIEKPEDDEEEEQGNNDPTVPDRPGSFELTPYKYALRLKWTDSASDGGSAITNYQYQYQSSNYNRTRWSSWSNWTSAGTGNSTWINGLSSGVNYAVRMRAVNAIGNSPKTGIKIVKTTQ